MDSSNFFISSKPMEVSCSEPNNNSDYKQQYILAPQPHRDNLKPFESGVSGTNFYQIPQNQNDNQQSGFGRQSSMTYSSRDVQFSGAAASSIQNRCRQQGPGYQGRYEADYTHLQHGNNQQPQQEYLIPYNSGPASGATIAMEEDMLSAGTPSESHRRQQQPIANVATSPRQHSASIVPPQQAAQQSLQTQQHQLMGPPKTPRTPASPFLLQSSKLTHNITPSSVHNEPGLAAQNSPHMALNHRNPAAAGIPSRLSNVTQRQLSHHQQQPHHHQQLYQSNPSTPNLSSLTIHQQSHSATVTAGPQNHQLSPNIALSPHHQLSPHPHSTGAPTGYIPPSALNSQLSPHPIHVAQSPYSAHLQSQISPHCQNQSTAHVMQQQQQPKLEHPSQQQQQHFDYVAPAASAHVGGMRAEGGGGGGGHMYPSGGPATAVNPRNNQLISDHLQSSSQFARNYPGSLPNSPFVSCAAAAGRRGLPQMFVFPPTPNFGQSSCSNTGQPDNTMNNVYNSGNIHPVAPNLTSPIAGPTTPMNDDGSVSMAQPLSSHGNECNELDSLQDLSQVDVADLIPASIQEEETSEAIDQLLSPSERDDVGSSIDDDISAVCNPIALDSNARSGSTMEVDSSHFVTSPHVLREFSARESEIPTGSELSLTSDDHGDIEFRNDPSSTRPLLIDENMPPVSSTPVTTAASSSATPVSQFPLHIEISSLHERRTKAKVTPRSAVSAGSTSAVAAFGRGRSNSPRPTAQCSICSKVFNNSSALAKHRLTHSDERKYSCKLCTKAFKRQDHLNGHMMTHREKKPFACQMEKCEKSYCDARSLKRHLENVHNIHPDVITQAFLHSSTIHAAATAAAAAAATSAPSSDIGGGVAALLKTEAFSDDDSMSMGPSLPLIPSHSQYPGAAAATSRLLTASTLSTSASVVPGASSDGLSYPAAAAATAPSVSSLHQVGWPTFNQDDNFFDSPSFSTTAGGVGRGGQDALSSSTATTRPHPLRADDRIQTPLTSTTFQQHQPQPQQSELGEGDIYRRNTDSASSSLSTAAATVISQLPEALYISNPVECEFCHRQFKNQPALNGHMRLHGGYTASSKPPTGGGGSSGAGSGTSSKIKKERKDASSTVATVSSSSSQAVTSSMNNNNSSISVASFPTAILAPPGDDHKTIRIKSELITPTPSDSTSGPTNDSTSQSSSQSGFGSRENFKDFLMPFSSADALGRVLTSASQVGSMSGPGGQGISTSHAHGPDQRITPSAGGGGGGRHHVASNGRHDQRPFDNGTHAADARGIDTDNQKRSHTVDHMRRQQPTGGDDTNSSRPSTSSSSRSRSHRPSHSQHQRHQHAERGHAQPAPPAAAPARSTQPYVQPAADRTEATTSAKVPQLEITAVARQGDNNDAPSVTLNVKLSDLLNSASSSSQTSPARSVPSMSSSSSATSANNLCTSSSHPARLCTMSPQQAEALFLQQQRHLSGGVRERYEIGNATVHDNRGFFQPPQLVVPPSSLGPLPSISAGILPSSSSATSGSIFEKSADSLHRFLIPETTPMGGVHVGGAASSGDAYLLQTLRQQQQHGPDPAIQQHAAELGAIAAAAAAARDEDTSAATAAMLLMLNNAASAAGLNMTSDLQQQLRYLISTRAAAPGTAMSSTAPSINPFSAVPSLSAVPPLPAAAPFSSAVSLVNSSGGGSLSSLLGPQQLSESRPAAAGLFKSPSQQITGVGVPPPQPLPIHSDRDSFLRMKLLQELFQTTPSAAAAVAAAATATAIRSNPSSPPPPTAPVGPTPIFGGGTNDVTNLFSSPHRASNFVGAAASAVDTPPIVRPHQQRAQPHLSATDIAKLADLMHQSSGQPPNSSSPQLPASSMTYSTPARPTSTSALSASTAFPPNFTVTSSNLLAPVTSSVEQVLQTSLPTIAAAASNYGRLPYPQLSQPPVPMGSLSSASSAAAAAPAPSTDLIQSLMSVAAAASLPGPPGPRGTWPRVEDGQHQRDMNRGISLEEETLRIIQRHQPHHQQPISDGSSSIIRSNASSSSTTAATTTTGEGYDLMQPPIRPPLPPPPPSPSAAFNRSPRPSAGAAVGAAVGSPASTFLSSPQQAQLPPPAAAATTTKRSGSPVRKKRKPNDIIIPPSVNNYTQQLQAHHLRLLQNSLSQSPYTPPPMLSPIRRGGPFGLGGLGGPGGGGGPGGLAGGGGPASFFWNIQPSYKPVTPKLKGDFSYFNKFRTPQGESSSRPLPATMGSLVETAATAAAASKLTLHAELSSRSSTTVPAQSLAAPAQPPPPPLASAASLLETGDLYVHSTTQVTEAESRDDETVRAESKRIAAASDDSLNVGHGTKSFDDGDRQRREENENESSIDEKCDKNAQRAAVEDMREEIEDEIIDVGSRVLDGASAAPFSSACSISSPFITSPVISVGSPCDIIPHVNIGPEFQAILPDLVRQADDDGGDTELEEVLEKDVLMWSPHIITSLHSQQLEILKRISQSMAIGVGGRGSEGRHSDENLPPPGGDNQELMLTLLNQTADAKTTLQRLLHLSNDTLNSKSGGSPSSRTSTIENSTSPTLMTGMRREEGTKSPCDATASHSITLSSPSISSSGYSKRTVVGEENWSQNEIYMFQSYLSRYDKNFYKIAKSMKSKSTSQCVEFYYLWKRISPDEHKRLRLARRKREQEEVYNLRARPASNPACPSSYDLTSSPFGSNIRDDFSTAAPTISTLPLSAAAGGSSTPSSPAVAPAPVSFPSAATSNATADLPAE